MKIGFKREKNRHPENQFAKRFVTPLAGVGYIAKKVRKDRLPTTIRSRRSYAVGTKHRNICVITMDNSAPYTRRTLCGIERVLSANGYNVIYRNSGNSQAKEERILKSMISKGVAGYIIEPSKSQIMCGHMYVYNRLDRDGVPYVFMRACYPQMSDKPMVTVDDNKGGYLLTRHMIATAGENIVGIFRADSRRGAERHKGYVRALQEAGIPYRPELVIWYHLEEQIKKPTLALDEILNTKVCDGIICYDDFMAENIMYYLFSNGYAVPDDIAVAGYGNTMIATAGELGLTTVAQPDELLGEIAAEYLIGRITSEIDSTAEKVLNPELVIRGSTIGTDI